MKLSLFQQLQEYTTLIHGNKLHGFRLFDERFDDSKISNLQRFITEGQDELSCAVNLGYKNEDSSAFKKLCLRLLEKLKASLFFLDVKKDSFTEMGSLFYNTNKQYFIQQTLLMLNKKNLAYSNINKEISTALSVGHPDLLISISRTLLNQYSYITPNQKKYKEIKEIAQSTLKKLNNEFLLRFFYCDISYDYVVLKKRNDYIIESLKDFMQSTNHIQNVELFPNSIILSFELKSLYYQLIRDYSSIAILAEETLNYLNSFSKTYLFETLVKFELIQALTMLGEFEEAEKESLSLIDITREGTFNWFKSHSIRFTNLMWGKKYDEAYVQCIHILKHKKLKEQSAFSQQWYIRLAYCYFLSLAGFVSAEVITEHPIKSFRLNKFLNQVPDYNKEKTGLNVSILLIQMLIYLVEKKEGLFIDRLDALNQYSYRYLRNNDTFRYNCMIKILGKIAEANFHPVATERHASSLLKKLSSHEKTVADQSLVVEIIPFEDLWDIMKDVLQRK